MADTETVDVAEKAHAEAADKTGAKPVDVRHAETAPATAKAAVREGTQADLKPAPVPKAASAKAAVVKTKAPAKKRAAKPVAAKPAKAAKPGRKAAAPKPASKPIKTVTQTLVSKLKDTKMANTTKKTADDFTGRIQDVVKDAQTRAKTAFEKSQAAFGDAGEFNKGNIEAVVESGKLLAQGLQAMGKTYVAEVKSTFEAVQADVKELTAVRSPAEFVQIQSSLLRKYFDNAVAYNSKSAEAALKLANDAFQPISNRVTLAVEKVRKAA
jgi:phasin family protein